MTALLKKPGGAGCSLSNGNAPLGPTPWWVGRLALDGIGRRCFARLSN